MLELRSTVSGKEKTLQSLLDVVSSSLFFLCYFCHMERITENQFVGTFKNNIRLYIKREDLIHPFISGNKFRKLFYNLSKAKEDNHATLLTFGGAYSNHIAAVAFAGKENGFQTIGVIRGDELAYKIEDNPTLEKARQAGMEFVFVTREQYRLKNEESFLKENID